MDQQIHRDSDRERAAPGVGNGVSMVSRETDPSIDLRRLEANGLRTPVLISVGGGGSPGAPPAAALIEIGRHLEVGRGPGQSSGRRLQTNDPLMSRRHVEFLVKLDGTVLARDLGSSNGTWIDGVRLEGDTVLHDGAVVFAGAHVFIHRLMTLGDRDAIQEDLARPFAPSPTLSPMTARLVRQLRQLAPSELDLLLGGETGVGKEVYAHAVHQASGRAGAFIAINCAALPDALIESELFRYPPAAHSMPDHNKPRLLEQAHGGTLFLDEIGDMPGTAQSKLLRFLQDSTFVPLGSVRARRVDVRVIPAPPRSLTHAPPRLPLDLAPPPGPPPPALP